MDFTTPNNELSQRDKTAADLRSAVRYPLQAPAVYSWTDCEGVTHESQGYTRDMSPRGIFIVSPDAPPHSTCLTVTIHVPLPEGGRIRDIRIEAVGKVIRVDVADEPGDLNGFSVKNERVRYEHLD